MNILTPVLIVVVIGLIAGIILTIAAKVMFVPVDERVAAIKEVLPGANCGACGFAGCADYAEALVGEPNLSPNQCPVGGSQVAIQIAGIVGSEAEATEPLTAIVKCNGTYNNTSEIMKLDGMKTCRGVDLFYGGHWACSYGCLGLGDCVRVCDVDAIKVVNGVAVVDRNKCVGCGVCIKECPNRVIKMTRKKHDVFIMCRNHDRGAVTMKKCSVGCIGCGKCKKACKFDAIYIDDNLAKMDGSKCVNCGACVKECPTGAIIDYRKTKPKVIADTTMA